MRVATPVDNHPQRDEIIRALTDESRSILSIHEEYGINRHTLAKARKKLRDAAGTIVAATLHKLTPEMAAESIDKPLTAESLLDDLAGLKHELQVIKTAPGVRNSTVMQAIDQQRRVIDSIVGLLDRAERYNRHNRAVDRLQRIEKALAATLRRVPEADAVFREEYKRLAPVDDDPGTPNEPG